ncbi:YbaN family protein [Emcibacteraceae bacterium]|nr:YbaN family protein [Emcibacteraceae bacterium]
MGLFKWIESVHNWLYNHPKFGPSLQQWDQHRVIPLKAKMTALIMMCISASYLIFFSSAPTIVIIISLGLMLFGILYVLSKPSTHREE